MHTESSKGLKELDADDLLNLANPTDMDAQTDGKQELTSQPNSVTKI
jgi:hypothetical protein